MFGASQEFRVENLQNSGLNLVKTASGIAAQPVEILLRWQYGTRYYPIPVTFFAVAMMMGLPLFLAAINLLGGIIPFLHIGAAPGMFDIASLAKVYFAVSIFHAYRTWRRMIHPSASIAAPPPRNRFRCVRSHVDAVSANAAPEFKWPCISPNTGSNCGTT